MITSSITAGLLALATLPLAAFADDVITSDSYFYGESPPVYPSPKIKGLGNWKHAYQQAVHMVSQMTLQEKLNMTIGVSTETGCSGFIPPVERLGFHGLCLQDAGNGLRNTDFVNSWPSGIHVASSWNRDLAKSRGHGMGGEFRKKGVNILLGPTISPMGRVLTGGRNWEGLSPDPFLAGWLVRETVTGIQSQGVTACTKHLIGYEQETYRDIDNARQAVSSNIDDKTMHELYLWPFQDAVLAGTGSIMCSYNHINNSYGCQNSAVMNGLLKTELGFQGHVMTDWFGLHGGYAAIEAGLDMAMPDGGSLWGPMGAKISEAIKNGSFPEARLDDQATRILAAWYQGKQDSGFPAPGVGLARDLSKPHKGLDARDPSSPKLLLQGAVEGHVLVKNTNNALPLKHPKLISVFGYSAKSPDKNNVDNFSFGEESFTGNTDSPDTLQIAFNGTLYSGGGSASTGQSLLSSPMNALNNQCWKDQTEMFWDFTRNDPTVYSSSDACLVFLNAWATEGYDRPGLADTYSDTLVKNVARSCSNTVVVIHNAGTRLVDAWIENPNVTAVVFAHLPGQASGEALVSLLYGRENFSGKLPYTVAKKDGDYGDMLNPSQPEGIFKNYPQSNFSEGTLIDYRRFDYHDIEPRFEFGFGLSYTTFEYSNLNIRPKRQSGGWKPYPTGPIVVGGQEDLWDELVTVQATVSNAGSLAGAEVAQLYISFPGAGENNVPVKVLRGFGKEDLQPGEAKVYTFQLTRRDLSEWDTVAQKWKLEKGTYKIMVGSSSKTLPLIGNFKL